MSDYIRTGRASGSSRTGPLSGTRALAGTALRYDDFWKGFAQILTDLTPKNRALLEKRTQIQQQLDDWHKARAGQPTMPTPIAPFWKRSAIWCPKAPTSRLRPRNTDPEIALIPGPSLVVPIMNARYALNAANARWGSLYDALYGTDALGDLPEGGGYDPVRGARVIAAAKGFLDGVLPLADGSWSEAVMIGKTPPALANPGQFLGSRDGSYYYENNGLKIVLHFDDTTDIGASDPLGLSDVRLESALSAIMDCEDSVAAVDAEDKVLALFELAGADERFADGRGHQGWQNLHPKAE